MLNQSNIQQLKMLEFGDITGTLEEVINTFEWSMLQDSFNKAKTILLVGHGGNLAVADHISVDITRLTNYKKSKRRDILGLVNHLLQSNLHR